MKQSDAIATPLQMVSYEVIAATPYSSSIDNKLLSNVSNRLFCWIVRLLCDVDDLVANLGKCGVRKTFELHSNRKWLNIFALISASLGTVRYSRFTNA